MKVEQRTIKGIMFDLGGTLMYAKNAWPPILARANRALADTLCAHGLDLDCDVLLDSFRDRLNLYYEQRDEDLLETTYMSVLHGLLSDQGYPEVPENIIRKALDSLYAVTQANWVLEPEARALLKTLYERGYRLGIVSNAGDNKDVFQLVDRFEIEPYFDFILTSAACSYRKPHRRIFELALAHWKLTPAETAMVGDTLDADILGANLMGIYSIWISRRANYSEADLNAIQPSAKIKSLTEIPALLKELKTKN